MMIGRFYSVERRFGSPKTGYMYVEFLRLQGIGGLPPEC